MTFRWSPLRETGAFAYPAPLVDLHGWARVSWPVATSIQLPPYWKADLTTSEIEKFAPERPIGSEIYGSRHPWNAATPKPAKPSEPPPSPATDWFLDGGYEWVDSPPGYWRVRFAWLPIVAAESVVIKPTEVVVGVTDPKTGERYTWDSADPNAPPYEEWRAKIDKGKFSGLESESVKKKRLAEEEELAKLTSKAGFPWLLVGGAVVVALLLARGGRRAE